MRPSLLAGAALCTFVLAGAAETPACMKLAWNPPEQEIAAEMGRFFIPEEDKAGCD
jgi:hypothetical protein